MEAQFIINFVILFFLSFSITSISVPLIIKFAQKQNLYDRGDERKVHTGSIPRLGGIAILLGCIVSQIYFLVESASMINNIQGYYYGLFVSFLIFIVGFVDDLIEIDFYFKLVIQIVAASLMTWKAGVIIESFYGLFGIFEIPLIISLIFSSLVIIFFINAYNFIDGLDSLSSSLGIYFLLVFLYVFILNDQYAAAFFCVITIGGLLGFLMYNKPPAKIFMGDCGTMTIGMLIACFAIKTSTMAIDSAGTINPVFIMISLGYPVIDTLRAFTVRIYNKKSPFLADRNHIHHALHDLGLSHGKVTVIILLFSIGFTFIAYFMRMHITLSYVVLVPSIILVSQIPFYLLSKKN